MTKTNRYKCLLFLLLFLVGLGHALSNDNAKVICDFEGIIDDLRWLPTNVEVELDQKLAKQGENSLKAVYAPNVDFSNIKLMDDGFGLADWSSFQGISLDIYNPTARQQRVYLKFFSKNGALDRSPIDLKPKKWTNVVVPFTGFSEMRGIELWMNKRDEPVTIYIDDVRLLFEIPGQEKNYVYNPEEILRTNMVKNPSFELVEDGSLAWWKIDRATLEQEKAKFGKYALEIEKKQTELKTIVRSPLIKVSPKKEYTLSAFLASYPEIGIARLYLDFFTKDKVWLGRSEEIRAQKLGGTLKRESIVLVVPDNAELVQINFEIDSNSPAGFSWIDGVYLGTLREATYDKEVEVLAEVSN